LCRPRDAGYNRACPHRSEPLLLGQESQKSRNDSFLGTP